MRDFNPDSGSDVSPARNPSPELTRALADIADIRSQIAAGALFQGFGPAVVAGTGALAAAAMTAQMLWPAALASPPFLFLLVWVVVAVISAAMVAAEMVSRSRRRHGGMATHMILCALEQFLPAGVAGAAIAWALASHASDTLWIAPGLWQILMALGVFAAARMLPRGVALVGAWYFVSGVFVLLWAAQTRVLAPEMMGVPFTVGQLWLAWVLHTADGDLRQEDCDVES